MRLLSCLPYFAQDPTLGLIPIANIMRRRVYKFGEAIIRRGEVPTSMFMIAKGMCHLVHIAGANRCMRPDINVRCMKKPLQDFNFSLDKTMTRNEAAVIEKFSKPVFSSNSINVEDYLKNSRKNGKWDYRDQLQKRHFQYTDLDCLNERNRDFKHYTEHFDLLPGSALSPPTPLCSRALLSKNIGLDGRSLEKRKPGILPARYTILAMSKEVVTYELRKDFVVYIPGPLKAVFLKGIRDGFDWDVCPKFSQSIV